MDNNYITVKDYAIKYGVAERTVRQKLQGNKIPGAQKIGRDWLIPADAPYPEDSRIKSGKYVGWRKKSCQGIDTEPEGSN